MENSATKRKGLGRPFAGLFYEYSLWHLFMRSTIRAGHQVGVWQKLLQPMTTRLRTKMKTSGDCGICNLLTPRVGWHGSSASVFVAVAPLPPGAALVLQSAAVLPLPLPAELDLQAPIHAVGIFSSTGLLSAACRALPIPADRLLSDGLPGSLYSVLCLRPLRAV